VLLTSMSELSAPKKNTEKGPSALS